MILAYFGRGRIFGGREHPGSFGAGTAQLVDLSLGSEDSVVDSCQLVSIVSDSEREEE